MDYSTSGFPVHHELLELAQTPVHRVGDAIQPCHPLSSPYCQSYSFSTSHVWIWELDHKECWVLKNWCFQTVVLEKTLESPSASRRSDQSILKDPKGNPPWIFIGRIDVEAEAPIFWPFNARSQHIGKNPDAGEDWGQEEKGATEDEMVGWQYWFNRNEFKQTWWDNEEQRSLACCSSRGWKELDITQRLNNNSIIEMEFSEKWTSLCTENTGHFMEQQTGSK